MRLSAEVGVESWVRGGEGRLTVEPQAVFLSGRHGGIESLSFRRGFSADHTLLTDAGTPVEGLVIGKTSRETDGWSIKVTVPELPDGDYTLRTEVDAGFDAVTVEVPVPFYAPALVHVATDRPLYKPGQEVRIRSVTWRRTDLAPLEQRPGTWLIRDPQGEIVHEERDAAGPWGVADTVFPLDRLAEVGTWKAEWRSGDTVDTTEFDVRPFKLPRFTVDLSAERHGSVFQTASGSTGRPSTPLAHPWPTRL
jgi:hypothetical protein